MQSPHLEVWWKAWAAAGPAQQLIYLFGLTASVGIAYFLAARLSLLLLTKPDGVAVFWPASGVAAGVLIALGPRARVPVAAGAMVATIIANLMGDRTLLSAIVFALCNAGEALLTGWLIERYFGFAFSLDRLSHVLGLLAAAITATTISGVGGTLGFLYFHNSTAPVLTTWQHWFASDALGIITVAPLMIEFVAAARDPPRRREIAEGIAALVALAILSGFVVFLPQGVWGSVVPIALLFPLLLWLTSRCHPVFAASAAFIIALTIVWTTTFSIGIFGEAGLPIAERVQAAQAAILAVALCALVLAGLFAERRLHETSLAKSSEELQAALTELRLLYESAPIGLAFLTPDCRYLQINRRLTEICDIPVADHIGHLVRDTVPQVAEQVERIVQTILLTGEPITDVEVNGQRPDGGNAERVWTTYWHPLKAKDGAILGINVVAQEITERKRTEAALRASERQFHTLADSIPQLVWMAQAGGEIFWFNNHWHAYMGLSAEEACRSNWTTVLDPVSGADAYLRWAECLKVGATFEMELTLRATDGRYTPFLTRIVPLRDPTGKVDYWIGTHVDISEQKNREEHIRFIVDELSHRTKNLLTVVMAVADQTARHAEDVTQYRDRFFERLKALSDCHDLLAKDQWHGATFGELLSAQMKPFHEMSGGQIHSVGPLIVLNPEAVHCLGLAFHELATNASKHGALSVPEGLVSIRWLLNQATDHIHVHWRESGGPLVVPPQRKGFGHVVIERIVPGMLKGTGMLNFTPSGVNWTFEFPAVPDDSR